MRSGICAKSNIKLIFSIWKWNGQIGAIGMLVLSHHLHSLCCMSYIHTNGFQFINGFGEHEITDEKRCHFQSSFIRNKLALEYTPRIAHNYLIIEEALMGCLMLATYMSHSFSINISILFNYQSILNNFFKAIVKVQIISISLFYVTSHVSVLLNCGL